MTFDELVRVFFPEDSERRGALAGGRRLVHYTTAEAAYKIIANKQVWLRNALLMNDFSEIEHGLNCLQAAWVSSSGVRLQKWLDGAAPGLREQLVSTFDAHAYGLKVATFVMSLSEHDDDEDELGRLSMWRAYGGKNGVGLVLNSNVFASATDALKAYSAPVSYLASQSSELAYVTSAAKEHFRF